MLFFRYPYLSLDWTQHLKQTATVYCYIYVNKSLIEDVQTMQWPKEKKQKVNSGLQNTMLKSNTRILLKHRSERFSGRVGHSCSLVALVMLHLLNIP
jgi:hypothetical protein